MIMPLSSLKESSMMVAVLCNALEESLNSNSNATCAIIPAWTAVEVNLTNAPLVEQVSKIFFCQLFPLPWPPDSLYPQLSGPVVRCNKMSSAFTTNLHHNLLSSLKDLLETKSTRKEFLFPS